TSSTVVTTAPTSTTNITGFFISVRGFSFSNESRSAPATIPPVHRDFFVLLGLLLSSAGTLIASGVIVVPALIGSSPKNLPGVHQQVFQYRSQAQRREKCQSAHDQYHRNQQCREKRRRHRKCACRFRHDFLSRQIAGNRQHRYHHKKSTQQHVGCNAGVVPKRVGAQPRKCRPVVRRARRICVQNLRQSVRTRICDTSFPVGRHHSDRRKNQNDQRENQHRQHGHLYVVRFDLFPQIFRRA